MKTRAPGWAGVGVLAAALVGLSFGCRPHPEPAPDVAPAPVEAGGAAVFTVEDNERLVVSYAGTARVALDLTKHVPARYFGTGEHSFEPFQSMHVEAVGKFEHDGIDEAVVSLFMGNACPSRYALVRAAAATLEVSDTFGNCLGTLRVVPGGSNDVFEVTSDEKTETFRPSSGRVIPLGEQSARARSADLFITYAEASAKGGKQVLTVDLDDDGKPDSIACVCQQGLGCTITSSEGTDWGTIIATKRFGVLSSKTRGHRDLMIDQRTVVRFRAGTYE